MQIACGRWLPRTGIPGVIVFLYALSGESAIHGDGMEFRPTLAAPKDALVDPEPAATASRDPSAVASGFGSNDGWGAPRHPLPRPDPRLSRWMPSLRMRASSVVGLRPRMSAA